MLLGAWMVGAWAALRVPYSISGARLLSVISRVDAGPGESPAHRGLDSAADPRVERALRVASRALLLLSRGRIVWRNTCLYRSVAQCLVLRHYGRTACVQVGVRRDGTAPDGNSQVQAHAWVVYGGPERVERQSGAGQFRVLAGPSA